MPYPIQPPGLAKFKEHYIYTKKDGGDFGRFQAKFNLITSLLKHPPKRQELLIKAFFKAHMTGIAKRVSPLSNTVAAVVGKRENIHQLSPHPCSNPLKRIAKQHNRALHHQPAPLGRRARLRMGARTHGRKPELIPTIVGIDFAHVEEGYPPKNNRALFQRVHKDNQQRPERALEITYHVGESYFDKSLESAIRWCHEVAEMGARRLGHATALGLDPAVAIARRPDAHAKEQISERLDQIAYDLTHASELSTFDIKVNASALQTERQTLKNRAPDEIVERPYNPQRLEEIRNRQQFVLNRLTQLGTVIETCPTSNLRIGGVPDPAHHPIHTFLKSNVNLVIGADDPGIFDSPLASEIDWAITHTNWTPEALEKRLGDPRRFQLGNLRPPRI